MFSDRYRGVKIGGIVLLLIFLAWYSDRRNQFPVLADCLREPERFAGREIDITFEPRVIAVDERRILVAQPDGPLEIIIPEDFDGVFPRGEKLADLNPGDSLEAVAVFRLPGYLELKAIRGSPLRRLKVALSIVPTLAVGFILLRTIRREKGFLVVLPDTSDAAEKSDNFKL